jgi:hypothetical protein
VTKHIPGCGRDHAPFLLLVAVAVRNLQPLNEDLLFELAAIHPERFIGTLYFDQGVRIQGKEDKFAIISAINNDRDYVIVKLHLRFPKISDRGRIHVSIHDRIS